MSKVKACVFDAYGTLFDVNAAAREVAAQEGREEFGLVWQQVAIDWRLKALQYSWLRTLTDDYVDFWQVTQDALDWALEASDQTDPELRELLLGLFWSLKAFEEVPEVLGKLSAQGVVLAILSNGTKEMLAGAVDSAGIGEFLSAVISVEDVGVFKPRRVVYEMVEDRLSIPPEEVLFISSNGWDVASAAAFGFRTLWVNRAGEPVDRIGAKPDKIDRTLDVLPDMIGE